MFWDQLVIRSCIRHTVLACSLLSTLTTGCNKTETGFTIRSFKQSVTPELSTQTFESGSFSVDINNGWDIVFEIPPTPFSIGAAPESMPTSAPQGDDDPEDAPREAWMSQLIHINMFWRPRPGTTHVESTQTNATIVYCLITDRAVATYKGAGFVFFKKSRDGETIEGSLESSTLAPMSFVDDGADLLGRCQLQGTFTAHQDRRHVVSVLQKLRKETLPRASD